MDVTTIAASVTTALTGSINLVDSLMKLRESSKLRSELRAVEESLMQARLKVIDLLDHYQSMFADKEKVEQELVKLKAWDQEKENYELRELAPGVLAYASKPASKPGQPVHWLCANCYHQSQKSILQFQHTSTPPSYACNRCKSRFDLPAYPKNIGRVVR